MEAKKVRAFDNLPYLIADEALRKNDASRQNMKILCQNMQQRARIEKNYVKMLQEWMKELGKDENGTEIVSDRLWNFITSSLRQGALKQAELHEEVYGLIMDGPCSTIEGGSASNSGNEELLCQLRERYAEVCNKRRFLEDDMRRRCSNEIHCYKLIRELETKLAHRSRITSGKKKTERGLKKIDLMRERLSLLREQTAQDSKKIEDLHREMDEFQNESKQEIEKITQEFGECEQSRMRFVAQQTRQFEKHLWPISGATRKKKMSDLEEQTIDKLLVESWAQEIIMKAKARKAGQVATIEELLKSLDKTATEKNLSSRPTAAIFTQKRHVHVFPKYKDQKEGDDDMSVLSVTCNISQDSNISAKAGASSGSNSDNLETIVVPGESTSGKRDKQNPFPTKEFCPAYSTDEEEDTPHQNAQHQNTSHQRKDCDSVDDIDWKTGRPVNQMDIGLLREVRVQAIQDYTAVHKSQISFRKGQIIKQKAGADEDGFCYGWTRETRLSAKEYGRYPKKSVTLYQPHQMAVSDT